jgi:hypothetical protein
VIEHVEQIEQRIRVRPFLTPLLYSLYRYSTRYLSDLIENRRHSIYSIDLGVVAGGNQVQEAVGFERFLTQGL